MPEVSLSKIMDVSLTRSCNYDCSYCNQRQDLDKPMFDMSESKRKIVSNKRRTGAEWIAGLNAFPYKADYDKLIFSGGEPSLHADFVDIVTQVKGWRVKVIVTNLSFEVEKLIAACRKEKTRFIVQPSYHFEFADFAEFSGKLDKLRAAGLLSNFIPASIVHLPDRDDGQKSRDQFKQRGYNAALYRFEGYYKGKFSYAPLDGFGGIKETKEVFYSSCVQPVKPNGDIVYCTTDTYSETAQAYGNICDQKFEAIPREIKIQNYGNRHISAASWTRARDTASGEIIWQGKNYRHRTPMNQVRTFLEIQNYSWLASAKSTVNALQNKLKSKAAVNQTNID
jgi:sulfatase maturation enzyme AslB (radical SAM superfamily)